MKKNVRERALSILERKDQTEYQMTKSLIEKGYSEEESSDTVEWLKELGYIDDIDYATRYLEILINKGRGRIRIRQEMQKRGLRGDEINNIIDDGFSPEQEKENAYNIAVKLVNSLPEDIDKKALTRKISSKLVTQGYNYDIINSIVSSFSKSDYE